MAFKLSFITPAGKVLEDTVDSLAAPGLEGGFEVFSGHVPLVAALKQGRIKVRKSGGEEIFTTGSGILEVMPDHNVLVLVDSAEGGADAGAQPKTH